MNTSIKLNAINHYFQTENSKITLFNDLSLSVNNTQINAITGTSGVGKSSLLLILAGLEPPKSGSVEFTLNGEQSSMLELRKQSGFIFQQFHLLPELDALNNIALPLKLKGDKQAKEKAHHWLTKVGLEKRAQHKPNQLSGGEQQRVAIARAFVSNPSFVFADEPTGNLDEATAAEIVNLMFECRNENDTGLVIVTHSKELSLQADRCHQLAKGALTTTENEAITKPSMENVA